jgi:sugar lactone lactonase YvrE
MGRGSRRTGRHTSATVRADFGRHVGHRSVSRFLTCVGTFALWKRCLSLFVSFVLVVTAAATAITAALTLSATPAGAVGTYVSPIAGTGTGGYSGDYGPAISAELSNPGQAVTDTAGNVFFIDQTGGGGLIREIVAATGDIETVTGLSSISGAAGLAIDSAGNLYISVNYGGAYLYYSVVDKWTASTGAVSIFAGVSDPYSSIGYSGDGGLATSAKLEDPQGLAVDSAGNVYMADTDNCVVREVSASTGDISTVAGDGTCGESGDGGSATSAELTHPAQVAVDSSGNLYIADTDQISEVSASTGDISQVVSGNYAGEVYDGGVYQAELSVDSSGNLYAIDEDTVDEIDPTTSSVTALSVPSGGYDNPAGVAVDSSGNVYVANSGDNQIDEISNAPLPIEFSPATVDFGTQDTQTTSGSETVAVTNTSLSTLTISSDALSGGDASDFSKSADSCAGAALGSDHACSVTVSFTPSVGGTRWTDLTFSDGISSGLNHVYLIGIGMGYVSAVAGTGTSGDTGDSGPAISAELSDPGQAVTDSSGNVFFIDQTSGTAQIRELVAATGDIETVTGLSSISGAAGLAIDSAGNLYFSVNYSTDYGEYLYYSVVDKWTASTGAVSTFAGVSDPYYSIGYSGDGGPATSAKLEDPQGLAVDSAGNVYIADTDNCVVREVSASTGDISTVAGSSCPTAGDTGDGGPATSGKLASPAQVAIDSSGNLYIADTDQISEVSASTGDISQVVSGNYAGESYDGGAYQAELSVDSSGNLYAIDEDNVDEIDPSTSSVTALSAPSGGYDDPAGVAVDSSGNVYVANTLDNQIDEISPYGTGPAGGLAGGAQRFGCGGGIAPGVGSCDGVGDIATGDFVQSVTDASVPTYGPPLAFTRTYDAFSAQAEAATSSPGPLGYGWTDNFATSLWLNSDDGTTASGDVTFVQRTGPKRSSSRR